MKHNTILILAALALFSCQDNKGDYCNLALQSKAFHSSAINYDLTAQLAVDGIVSDEAPSYYTVESNGAPIIREDLAWLFDYRSFTCYELKEQSLDLVVRFHNMDLRADALEFLVMAQYPKDPSVKRTAAPVTISISEDGETWQTVRSCNESELGPYDERWFRHVNVALPREMDVKAFRFNCENGFFDFWRLSSLSFFLGGQTVDVYNSVKFSSAWMPEGQQDEWIYVDLGGKRAIDKVFLDWLNRPQSGEIFVSNDAKTWKKKASFTAEDEIKFKATARYVKLQTGPSENGKPLCLREMQVMGWKPVATTQSDWYVVREDLQDQPWAYVPCKVPSTVLAAYLDAGILPDPSWADNNQQISDSYFRSNFLYKGVMKAPEDLSGRTYLNFDGINWKADVRMNGVKLGRINGAFIRTLYDVTDIVKPGDNEIEVLIHVNDHPSCGKGNTLQRDAYNGGILGADNPTFHASIGWDWIPNVHGRNIGIWNDVFFSTSGCVQIKDPLVSTVLNLPDTTHASVTLGATLVNRSSEPATTNWEASLGEFSVSEQISLAPGESKTLSKIIEIDNPRLWWPNGYGEQNLYDVEMKALCEGSVSDSKSFKTGLRQNTYDISTGRLTAWVNGRRFSGRGGNWGFSEYNLRYREKEYDTAVRLHKEQNFTMIRNWVGQTMDDEFYEACDRHGIMVWQDFWLANPLDGPDPYDEDMFMENLEDLLLRIRNHPSIVVYVGRNEGVPPMGLNTKIAGAVRKIHPDIFYAPDSSHGFMGGNGHYNRFSALDYFSQWSEKPNLWGQDRVHSEKGCPNVPNFESFVKFMPEDHYWPQDDMWGVHDWTLKSAQRVGSFNDAVRTMFGEPSDAKQFCEWSQWVNYDAFRAIFESRSEGRRGLQLWMSHPAWPTFVWCTYDYWFDPTAAFFGCKKACEPIHVMWNPLKKVVEVVNISAGNRPGLELEGRVLDMHGNVLTVNTTTIDSDEDSTVPGFSLIVPEDQDVFYYSLALKENGNVISSNFYVQGRETDNFKALHTLKKASLSVKTNPAGENSVNVVIRNTGKVPAMMLRLLATDGKGGERLLPVSYSDNYFHLMPGETKTVRVSAEKTPYINITGFNY